MYCLWRPPLFRSVVFVGFVLVFCCFLSVDGYSVEAATVVNVVIHVDAFCGTPSAGRVASIILFLMPQFLLFDLVLPQVLQLAAFVVTL